MPLPLLSVTVTVSMTSRVVTPMTVSPLSLLDCFWGACLAGSCWEVGRCGRRFGRLSGGLLSGCRQHERQRKNSGAGNSKGSLQSHVKTSNADLDHVARIG